MHSIKLLYVDGNDVRRTIDIEAPDLIKPIGLQRYTDFENVANTGPEPNGTYPVLDDKTIWVKNLVGSDIKWLYSLVNTGTPLHRVMIV